MTRSRTRFGGHVEVFAVLLASRPSRGCLSLCPAVCGFCHTHLRRRLSRQFQRNCISPGSAGTHALSSKVPISSAPSAAPMFNPISSQSHFVPVRKRERERGKTETDQFVKLSQAQLTNLISFKRRLRLPFLPLLSPSSFFFSMLYLPVPFYPFPPSPAGPFSPFITMQRF